MTEDEKVEGEEGEGEVRTDAEILENTPVDVLLGSMSFSFSEPGEGRIRKLKGGFAEIVGRVGIDLEALEEDDDFEKEMAKRPMSVKLRMLSELLEWVIDALRIPKKLVEQVNDEAYDEQIGLATGLVVGVLNRPLARRTSLKNEKEAEAETTETS
jgi:hypothetical protein